MIVDPDFLTHWRTLMLIDELGGDQMAPLYVIRIWGHCQQRRSDTFEMPAAGLKALCRFHGDADKFECALVSAGFLERQGIYLIVPKWKDHNAAIVKNWTNGSKGGRPKTEDTEPNRNPNETQTKPTANPNITQGEPNGTQSEPIGEDKREDKSQQPISEQSLGESSPAPAEPSPPPKNRQTIMPADFYPNETGVRYAEERGINIAIELQGMRNWAESKRILRSSWQATWRTWCDKAVEFGRAGVQAHGARASPQFDARSQDRKRAIAELTGQNHEPRIEREINPTLRLASASVG